MSLQPATGMPRCDTMRQRRSQRAFRMTVALILFLSTAWWFAESYLRYDHSETQYRLALTLQRAQARPILRTVVRHETEKRDVPPALYVEALAEVEERDKILSTYAQALQLNPKSESLLINYGCRLYAEGHYDEARERFREAGINPPRNVLPRYLESAALAASFPEKEHLNDAAALLARANSSSDPLLVPAPLWHDSQPRQGKGYLMRHYHLMDRIFQTIHASVSRFCEYLDEEVARENVEEMDSYLEKLEVMSLRLLGTRTSDSPPALPQLEHALQIQLEVLQQRESFVERFDLPGDNARRERIALLTELLADLDKFNEAGKELSDKYAQRIALPFRLILYHLITFSLFYFLTRIWLKFSRKDSEQPVLPLSPWAKKLLFCGFLLFFLLLSLFPFIHGHNGDFMGLYPLLIAGKALLYLQLFLVLYFSYTTWRRFLSAADKEEVKADWVRQKTVRIRLFMGLLRRYSGLLLGGLIICVGQWLRVSRIVHGAYPFQSVLLPSGLEMDISALITSIMERISAF